MNFNKIIILSILFCAEHCFCQNLVLNPSFETYCGKYPCNWHEISGTPDVYTKNKSHISYSLHILNDYKEKTIGNVFIGIGSSPSKSGEGIQGTLACKLDSNRLYHIKLYAMSYHFCNGGFKSIKVSLTDTILNKTVEPFFYKLTSINLYSKDSSIIKSKNNWIELASTYVAKGNEKYIYVTGQSDTVKSALKMGCVMRYFDSVIVEPTNIFYNTPMSIDSVFFEVGKDKISTLSYPKLNKLAIALSQDINSKIKINGHTDNVGSKQKNITLSKMRAQAVVNYLVSKGIEKNRLIANGFGDSFPIADNMTEGGRAKNRRIEFVLIK